MSITADIMIYGDSIMKAVMPDQSFHYSSNIKKYLEKFQEKFQIIIVNRAKFGAVISKGYEILQSDLSKGINCKYALLEYGGNDCDFYWEDVAADPQADHQPKTQLDKFVETLRLMINQLKQAGVEPVLMTLPPIDSERYFKFIVRNGLNEEGILHWLGDINNIYKTQETYSDAVFKVAAEDKLQLIDVRRCFLEKENYREMISEDGIHPARAGYELIYQIFCDYFNDKRTGLA